MLPAPGCCSRSRSLAALLLAATAVFAVQVRNQRGVDSTRADALRAARQEALNLTTISVSDFDASVQRVVDGATSDFKSEFQGDVDVLRTTLTQNKVESAGSVIDAGIVRSDDTNATVLVVIDATVKNVEVPDGRVNTCRMQLQLEKVGARWLTSTLQFVG